METLEDRQLLRLYATERSQAAFSELVRRHLTLVYRSALRQVRGDTHLAEDVSQRVFTIVAQRAGSLARHPRFVGWLYTTTHHVTSVSLRAERRRRIREKEAHVMHEVSMDSVDPAELDQVRALLDESLRALGELDREAVLLHFFEGQTLAEVGAVLSLKEDAARMRVRRALEKLRERLVKRGINCSGAVLTAFLIQEGASAAPAALVASVSTLAGASVVGGASGLLALLHLMSTSKLSIGVVALLLLAAGGTAVSLHQRLKSASAAFSAIDHRVGVEQTRLATVREEIRGLSHPPSISPVLVAGAATPIAITTDAIATELAKRRLQNRLSLASWTLTLRPLLKQRGVTDEQLNQYVASAVKTLSEIDDLAIAAKLAGVDFKSDPELVAEGNRVVANFLATAASEIGAANLQLMKDVTQAPNLSQKYEAQYVTTQVAGLVFNSGTPMNAADRSQLVDLIASNSPQYGPGDSNSMDTIYWDQLVAAAQGIVSPAELSALKTLQSDTARGELKKQVAQVAAAKVGK